MRLFPAAHQGTRRTFAIPSNRTSLWPGKCSVRWLRQRGDKLSPSKHKQSRTPAPTKKNKKLTNLLQRLAGTTQARPKRAPSIPQTHFPLIIRSREQVIHARIPPDTRNLAIILQRHLRTRTPRLNPTVSQDNSPVFTFFFFFETTSSATALIDIQPPK